MVTCCVYQCNNSSYGKHKKEGITFHSFPQDSKRSAVWTSKVNRKDWTPSSYTKICSEHFDDDCFEEDLYHKYVGRGPGKKAIKRLKPDAIPSLRLTGVEEKSQSSRSQSIDRIKKKEHKQVM